MINHAQRNTKPIVITGGISGITGLKYPVGKTFVDKRDSLAICFHCKIALAVSVKVIGRSEGFIALAYNNRGGNRRVIGGIGLTNTGIDIVPVVQVSYVGVD